MKRVEESLFPQSFFMINTEEEAPRLRMYLKGEQNMRIHTNCLSICEYQDFVTDVGKPNPFIFGNLGGRSHV
jgi:hypothetical protein